MKKNNNGINNLKLYAYKSMLAFTLMTTPLGMVGCQTKKPEANIEKTIEKNEANTYMGIVLSMNKDLKKDITELEKAVSSNSKSEKTRRFIMDNSKQILELYLEYLITSTMCDANDECIYNSENYEIHTPQNKYDSPRFTITEGDNLYIVKKGKLKDVIEDYNEVLALKDPTNNNIDDYKHIKEVAKKSIEDSKKLIQSEVYIEEQNLFEELGEEWLNNDKGQGYKEVKEVHTKKLKK